MAPDVKTPPLHSRRVQVWVYAVINPLIEALQREVALLRRGDLSWRSYSTSCEYIRVIYQYVEPSQYPNYEDFLADNPDFKKEFEEHDAQVSKIESDITYFVSGLLESQVFQERVRDTLEAYELSARGDALRPKLDGMKDRLPNVVAELLVNRAKTLPSHYVVHKYWEEFRKRFEPVEELFELHQKGKLRWQVLEGAAAALRETSAKLEDRLKHHRQFLCREYDIPFAPYPINQEHRADAFV
jgi:hypothetical protein